MKKAKNEKWKKWKKEKNEKHEKNQKNEKILKEIITKSVCHFRQNSEFSWSKCAIFTKEILRPGTGQAIGISLGGQMTRECPELQKWWFCDQGPGRPCKNNDFATKSRTSHRNEPQALNTQPWI